MHFTHKKRVSKDGNDLEIKNSPYLSIIPGNKETVKYTFRKKYPTTFSFWTFYTLEDCKPPKAVMSSRATLPINELKRTYRVRI
jgi:hypothetical protein